MGYQHILQNVDIHKLQLRSHMSYRKGSLQRYLAGYLAIEFTLEIWKSQSVSQKVKMKRS